MSLRLGGCQLDLQRNWRHNQSMEIQGVVQDGVVVLDDTVLLPEGSVVTVAPRSNPVIRVAKDQKRVEFPLVPSTAPGSILLTNERIAEILEEEDIKALSRSWDVPS
jgi:hypothetical protein